MTGVATEHATPTTTTGCHGLAEIAARLEAVVLDRTTYVKSQDVAPLLADTLAELKARRASCPTNCPSGADEPADIRNCFYLLSLAFLATGQTQEAPATYAQLVTIELLLAHLKEAAYLSTKDLDAIDGRLVAIAAIIDRTESVYDVEFVGLLRRHQDACKSMLVELRTFLSGLDAELAKVYNRLVEIMRSLAACNTRKKFPATEVKGFVVELEDIADAAERLGVPVDEVMADVAASRFDDSAVSQTENTTGNALIASLLTRALLAARTMAEREGEIDDRFKSVYETLLGVRDRLEKMVMTQSWSVRETDLFPVFKTLARIDAGRRQGLFVDDGGQEADVYTQKTLVYLLRKGYALVYQVMVASEPVSEALLPIYTQLKTVRQCLVRLADEGGVSSPREVYPYSLKLQSLDAMRVDGKFVVNQETPEGQGAVEGLYEECVGLVRAMWRAPE